MVLLGLTGSIGMGKTTAAGMLRGLGVAVYDSDAAVHRLLGRGGAAGAAVDAAFPGVVGDGAVDRLALGKLVFEDPAALKKLEAIVHPPVRAAQSRFLRLAAARRERLVVLDVPLLFETAGDALCDATIVVTAPPFIQRSRVLARPGITQDRFDGILARQMSDAEKRGRADFVVPSGLGKALTLRRLKEIVLLMTGRRGRHWPPPARTRDPSASRSRGIHARNRP